MRSRARTRTALLVGALASAALFHGCYGATEVTLSITTDIPCSGTDGTPLRTAVFVDDGDAPVAETTTCAPGADDNAIGTLVIAPSGARDERLTVDVVMSVDATATPTSCHASDVGGALGASCVAARRIFTFVPHETKELPIRLYRDCLGVTCAKGQTCSDGVCVGADIVPIKPPAPPAPPPSDAGPDVGKLDAGRQPCTGPAGDEVLSTIPIADYMLAGVGDTLYFIGKQSSTGTPALYAVDKHLGGAPAPIPTSNNVAVSSLLLASLSYVWWTEGSGGDASVGSGRVVEHPFAGPEQSWLAEGDAGAFSVTSLAYASSTNRLYWSGPTGTVMTHVAGTPKAAVADTLALPGDLLAASDKTLYVVAKATSRLDRYPLPATDVLGPSLSWTYPHTAITAIAATSGGLYVADDAPAGATGGLQPNLSFVPDGKQATDPGVTVSGVITSLDADDSKYVYMTVRQSAQTHVLRVQRSLGTSPIEPIEPTDRGFDKASNLVVNDCVYFLASSTSSGVVSGGSGAPVLSGAAVLYVFPRR